MNKREKGNSGEDCAATYLINNGYQILNRNYYTKRGEIDIVAKEADIIVFIEVKTRKNNRYGTAAEAVNAAKQKKMAYAANSYIQQKNLYNCAFRFDVIEVSASEKNLTVKNHIQDAFEVKNGI